MVDKRALVDSVTIQKRSEKDDWGKGLYSAPLLLSPVRFDRNYNAPGAINNPAGTKNPMYSKPSVLFVYTQYCDVQIDDTYRSGIIKDGDREYIINKIIPVYYPFKNKVYCYEIEVM